MASRTGALDFATAALSVFAVWSATSAGLSDQNANAVTVRTAVTPRAASKATRSRAFISDGLQVRNRAGADTEPICLDPEALQHAEVKVAQLRAAQSAPGIGLV